MFSELLEHAKQAYEDEQYVMDTGISINIVEAEGKDEFNRTKIAHTRKYPLYNHHQEVVGTLVITEDLTTDVALLKESQEKTNLLTKFNQELTEENTIDVLSQLYNRRFIRAQLDSLFKKYKDSHIPFSIIMVDIDDFKGVNDQYGHSTGDDVITYIGIMLLKIKK